jgi:hypothetical protein
LSLAFYFQPVSQKRNYALKDDGFKKKTNKEKDYTPLPSLAFTRSSRDLHLRHLIALGALDAPQCIHIFLFNNRSSASGNLAILYYRPLLF